MGESTRPAAAGFLVRLPAGAGVALARGAAQSKLRAAGVQFELEPMFAVPAQPGGLGLTATGWEWHVAHPSGAPDMASPWDIAHALTNAARVSAGGPVFVEPDLIQDWPYQNPPARDAAALAAAGDTCVFNDRVPRCPASNGRSRGTSATSSRSYVRPGSPRPRHRQRAIGRFASVISTPASIPHTAPCRPICVSTCSATSSATSQRTTRTIRRPVAH